MKKTEKTAEKATVSVYDFRNPKLISKEVIRSLNGMHDVIARQLARIFSAQTRIKSEVSVKEVSQIGFPDYVSRIPSPAALFRFPVQGFPGDVLLELEPGFCIYTVERQSGASATDVKVRRELSLIEERVTGKMIEGIRNVLNTAWDPYMKEPFGNWKYDSKPENIQIPAGLDAAIVVAMTISTGDHTLPFNICYPYNMVKDSLQNRSLNIETAGMRASHDPAEQEQFRKMISSVKTPVRAVLGTASITFAEVLDLKVGDAIKLDRSVAQPLDVLVGDRLVMKAFPGTVKSKKGIKVFELMPDYRGGYTPARDDEDAMANEMEFNKNNA